MASSASRAFIDFGVIGIILAFYHAWLEQAFTTNFSLVYYAPFASFFGLPYWVCGVVWYPVVFAVGLWSTRLGRIGLDKKLLILLTVGNLFTMYFWYLDIFLVQAFNTVYIGLYATNYVLTGLVVFQNRSNNAIHEFVYGTIVGAAVGLIFGLFGVVVLGIVGGILASVRHLAIPRKESIANPRPTA